MMAHISHKLLDYTTLLNVFHSFLKFSIIICHTNLLLGALSVHSSETVRHLLNVLQLVEQHVGRFLLHTLRGSLLRLGVLHSRSMHTGGGRERVRGKGGARREGERVRRRKERERGEVRRDGERGRSEEGGERRVKRWKMRKNAIRKGKYYLAGTVVEIVPLSI